MFLNCPHCGALIAADPVSALPPPHCPRCGKALPEQAPEPAAAPEAVPDAPASPAPSTAKATAAAAAAETPQAADTDADAVAAEAPVLGMADGLPCPLEPVQPAVDPAAATTGDDAPAARANAAAPPETRPSERKKAARPRKRADKPPARDTTPEHGATDGAGVDRAPDAPVQEPGDRAADADAAAVPPDRAPSPPMATAAAVVAAPALPRFARVRARAAGADGPRRWLLPSLIAGLFLLLVLQWILADRARLAVDARWRPLVAELCGVLRCTLPAWREPSAFVLMDRDVRPHPTLPGVLRVSATFRNDARWAQPWPELVLTLSDVDGRTAGARAFKADEYLGNAPTQKVLASGQTATVRLEILEPTPHVVAFAFDFR